MSFRIEPNKILESGAEHVDFDPSKVVLHFDEENTSTYNNKSSRRIMYVYEDAETSQKIMDLNYSFQWGKTKSQQYGDRWNSKGIMLVKTVSTQLRKRPNKDEYTQKSLDNHVERASTLDSFTLEVATKEFKTAIEEFNVWYVDEQTKLVARAFSVSSSWKFDDYEDIEAMKIELAELTKRKKELSNKLFDRKHEIMVTYVKDKAEKIAEEFKKPLIDAIVENQNKGDRNPFFG